jgi:hypothetical protein
MPTVEAGSTDPLFRSQAPLKVEITAPLSTLVRARGNFWHRNCDFPPITLNFRRSQVEGTLFEQQNKLKMVNHYKITRQYEQAVLREYLAFRQRRRFNF